MQQVGRVHEFQTLQVLVDDILLVDVFKNIGSDNSMQVRIHEVKDKVYIAVVLSSDHILQSDYILMASQLLQKDDLTESSLRIGRILESVEIFLQGNDLLGPLIDCLPDDTISSLSYNRKTN